MPIMVTSPRAVPRKSPPHEPPDMRILITFAVEAEFAPWKRMHEFRKEELLSGGHAQGASAVYRTQVGNVYLDVGFTGIGWSGVNQGLDHLLSKKPDVWISSGLAGALRDSLQLSDVIAPHAVLSKTSAESPTDRLEVDKELRELALNTGAKAAECLLTTCRVLTLAVEKKAQGSAAELVDMESFDVIREARKRGSRGVIIRAISDSADEDLPIDFNDILSRRRQVSLPRVLLRLAKNPLATPRLIRFGKQSRKAAQSLALFLDSYVFQIAQLPSSYGREKVA